MPSVQVRLDPQQAAKYRVVTEGSMPADASASTPTLRLERTGAGADATALIEIIPVEGLSAPSGMAGLPPLRTSSPILGGPAKASGDAVAAKANTRPPAQPLLTLNVVTGGPDAPTVQAFSLSDSARPWTESTPTFQWSAGVASLGLVLEDSPFKGEASWKLAEELARDGDKGQPAESRRQLFDLIEKAKTGK